MLSHVMLTLRFNTLLYSVIIIIKCFSFIYFNYTIFFFQNGRHKDEENVLHFCLLPLVLVGVSGRGRRRLHV